MKARAFCLVWVLSSMVFASASGFEHFITRDGHQLYDGDEPFRFISFNIPELSMRENPFWGVAQSFAQKDALRTIKQFGGKVTRTYVFSVAGTGKEPTHIEAPGQFNEEAFVAFDRLLATANEEGVRVIVPFIDTWHWWGGIDQLAAMRGKKARNFYSDEQLKADYKALVSFVLNRTNTLTGVKYKDDKAILAWETGNELRKAPTDWTLEMASFIKSIDANHLVIDGNDEHTDQAILDSEHIDIITRHYYGDNFRNRHVKEVSAVNQRKVVIVGEFGLAPFHEISGLIGAVIDTDTAGALIWSLRQHDALGGWHWHQEGSTGYKPYHYPGFESGNAYSEIDVVEMLKSAAAEIADVEEPDDGIPEAPKVLPIMSVLDIRWQGSVGARYYEIQRLQNDEWVTVADRFIDSDYRDDYSSIQTLKEQGRIHEGVKLQVMAQDLSAQLGHHYWYRVRAVNDAGSSEWSAPMRSPKVSQSNGILVEKDLPVADVHRSLQGELNSLVFSASWPEAFDTAPIVLAHTGDDDVELMLDYQDNLKTKKAFDPTFVVQDIPANTLGFSILWADSKPDSVSLMKYGMGTVSVELPTFKKRLWPPNVIDDFDVYEGLPQKLNETWKRNTGGNDIRLSLVEAPNDTYKMKVDYELGSPNYAGFQKLFDEEDWSDYSAVSFHLGSIAMNAGVDFTVQFRCKNGSYWEAGLEFPEKETKYSIPFDQFKRPSWQSNGAAMDLSAVVEVAFYVGGTANGAYTIDSIHLEK